MNKNRAPSAKQQKRRSKKQILLLFVIVICLSALLITLLIMQEMLRNNSTSQSSPPQEVPSSVPTSSPANIITIDGAEQTTYTYAAIEARDAVTLFTETGRSLTVALEQEAWNHIQASQSGNRIALLGEQTEGIFDIFTYDIVSQKERWATNYASAGSGVTDFIWQDSDTILFQQGEGIDNWLHRYDVPTESERFKVARIDGIIEAISPDQDRLVYRMNNNAWKSYSTTGEEIWDLSDIRDASGNTLTITDVMFVTQSVVLLSVENPPVLEESVDSDTNIIENEDRESELLDHALYKISFGSPNAVSIDLDTSIMPVCALENNFVLGWYEDSESIHLARVNTRLETYREVFSIPLESTSIVTDSFLCTDSETVLYSFSEQFSSDIQWALASSQGIRELPFLENAQEVVAL